jgi:hypothetical protein
VVAAGVGGGVGLGPGAGGGVGLGLCVGLGAGFAGLAAGARRTIALPAFFAAGLGAFLAAMFAAVFLAVLRGNFFAGIRHLHSLAQRSQRDCRERCSWIFCGSVFRGSRGTEKGPSEADSIAARLPETASLSYSQTGLGQSGSGTNAT